MRKLVIRICVSHQNTFRRAVEELGLVEVVIAPFSGNCNLPASNVIGENDDHLEAIDSLVVKPSNCRLKDIGVLSNQNLETYDLNFCYEYLIDDHSYQRLLEERAYIITEEWLLDWRRHLDEMGFTKENLKNYFSDWCEKICLLTVNDEIPKVELNELVDYLECPFEIVHVSMGKVNRIIENIYYKWKLGREEENHRLQLSDYYKKISNLETMRLMINEISQAKTYNHFYNQSERFWKMLFGAQKVSFSLDVQGLSDKKLFYEYCETENCLSYELRAKNEKVCQCEVRDFIFPENISRYAEQIKTLISVSLIKFSDLIETDLLRKAKAKLQLIFDSVNDGLFVFDSDDKLININQRGMTLLRTLNMDISGISILNLTAQKHDFWVELSTIYKKVKHDTLELYSSRNIQIGEHYFEFFLYPIIVDDGTKNGVLLNLKDVTKDVKLMEGRIIQERLEGLRSISSGIAHEFNNIAFGAQGFIELALEEMDETDSNFNFLSNAAEILDRITGLTGKLMTFSGGGEPVKRSIDIVQTIKGIITDFQNNGKENIVFTYKDFPIIVKIDEFQLSTALKHIIKNAINSYSKAETDKKVIINAGYQKNRAVITIEDKGCGIMEQDLTKVFDPFFTTIVGQEGLGLAVTYSIIEQHSGEIKLASKPGVGTIIEISLPSPGEITMIIE